MVEDAKKKKLTKRQARIAAAKARTPEETAKLRKRERAIPISRAVNFKTGPNKGRLLIQVLQEKGVEIFQNE